jgi:hypothetical protein
MQEAVRECCLHRLVHESEKAENEQRATESQLDMACK